VSPHAPPDTLYLWYLGKPDRPVLIGELNLVMGRRGVSLQYCPSWIAHGFALSEDLPLQNIEHFPREKDTAAGAVNDARPDRWGERVIRLIGRPARLSLRVQKLCFN
jgi:serine/threonine-protein kinase HipA